MPCYGDGMNADLRLELFDGARWFPMEFPRDDEAITFETLRSVARTYVERGAAKSVRVQRRSGSVWRTVKTITMTIVETDSEPVVFKSSVCDCGHLNAVHEFGGTCGQTSAGVPCGCLMFELKEV